MAPKSKQQYEGIREEKKALIMEVALYLFANEGFRGTTINNIAKHAGISKGLLYIYFKSKEDLLSEIIEKSVSEIYNYFDLNRDGYLTEEEFEFFIRKLSRLINEKQTFWRLFFQVLMQSEVRENFLNTFLGTESLLRSAREYKEGSFISNIMKLIMEYFVRKKEIRGNDYDPWLEMNMFLLTIKGFAITYVFMDQDKDDDEYFEKTVNNIIALFK
jgi:AcrR family transcriptional regulator